MSPARKKRAASASRSRRRFLVSAVILSIATFLAIHYGLRSGGPEVPAPELSAMEPQVAAKIGEAREAVLAAPSSHEAWGRLGMVLHAHRLEQDAAACYRRAAELSPTEFRWRYLLAHAVRDSDRKGSLADAEAASRLDPGYAPAYVLRGQLLEGENLPELALEQYRKAAEVDRENAMAEFGQGRLYLAKGELPEALSHLLRARDLSGEAPAVHGALAQTYRQLGDQQSALKENRLASQLTETVPITDPIHYAMRKESVSSIAQLERAIEADRAGDHETAETLYQGLVRLRPDDANIRARFGDTLARQSRIQPAKEQYQAALAVDSGLASAHYGLGNMLNFEGDYEGAARHYRAALAARPDHVSTLVNLAGVLAFRGELSEAESMCRAALELDPRGFTPNLQLGRVLVQQNRYKQAIPFLRGAVEARPDSGPAHLQLGLALAATGDLASAREHLDRAGKLGERIPPALEDELRRRVSEG